MRCKFTHKIGNDFVFFDLLYVTVPNIALVNHSASTVVSSLNLKDKICTHRVTKYVMIIARRTTTTTPTTVPGIIPASALSTLDEVSTVEVLLPELKVSVVPNDLSNVMSTEEWKSV